LRGGQSSRCQFAGTSTMLDGMRGVIGFIHVDAALEVLVSTQVVESEGA
jgi:hypothetical protein